MKVSLNGLRRFSYRLRESISEALPGMVRIGGATVFGPKGIAVAGWRTSRESEGFGGGQVVRKSFTVAVEKSLLEEAELPKQGALIEARLADEDTWRRGALRSIEGRGAAQGSWVLICGEAE